MTNQFDIIILGQGLAGTTLNWCIQEHGLRTLVVDGGVAVTSSRIAAGLVTPITGQRLVTSWRLNELWPFAKSFYRKVESRTGTTLLTPRRVLRLFRDTREAGFYQKHRSKLCHLIEEQPLYESNVIRGTFGAIEILDAGQLDVRGYLDVSRAWFEREGGYLRDQVDCETDIRWSEAGVKLTRLDVQAHQLVFCQGFSAISNPWFSDIPFDATKGEILTLRIPGLLEQRIVNCGIWLAPLGDSLFLAGSTYDHERLDCEPTLNGRQQILSRLQRHLRLGVEVVDHVAAVRPIISGRHPVIGRHPLHPQLAFFHGLGSKGTLQAPYFASQLANLLAGCTDRVDTEVDIDKRITTRDR